MKKENDTISIQPHQQTLLPQNKQQQNSIPTIKNNPSLSSQKHHHINLPSNSSSSLSHNEQNFSPDNYFITTTLQKNFENQYCKLGVESTESGL